MKVLVSLAAVGILFLFGLLGAAGMVPEAIFGVRFPYLAVAVFLGGLTYRVLSWAKRCRFHFAFPRPAARRSPFPGSSRRSWTTPAAPWASWEG